MKKKRRRIIALLVGLIVSLLIGSYVFWGVWWSTEYYEGYDWNTREIQVEWRLRKEHGWSNDGDERICITDVEHYQENKNIRVDERYYFDKERGKLKKVEKNYTTQNSAEMEQIYQAEVLRARKKFGNGIEYESSDNITIEWRKKHSTIYIIKNDYEYDDSNTAVRVVYLNNSIYNEPYFTKNHLDERTFGIMMDRLYCTSSPSYDEREINRKEVSDYSNFKLIPTEETRKTVALMNKYLFGNGDKGVHKARTIAKHQGITPNNQLSVKWVMEHPAKTVKILIELTWDNDDFKDEDWIDQAYEELTEEEKKSA